MWLLHFVEKSQNALMTLKRDSKALTIITTWHICDTYQNMLTKLCDTYQSSLNTHKISTKVMSKQVLHMSSGTMACKGNHEEMAAIKRVNKHIKMKYDFCVPITNVKQCWTSAIVVPPMFLCFFFKLWRYCNLSLHLSHPKWWCEKSPNLIFMITTWQEGVRTVSFCPCPEALWWHQTVKYQMWQLRAL